MQKDIDFSLFTSEELNIHLFKITTMRRTFIDNDMIEWSRLNNVVNLIEDEIRARARKNPISNSEFLELIAK